MDCSLREYGPTTCAHFASLHPWLPGMPSRRKITSPVQLGRAQRQRILIDPFSVALRSAIRQQLCAGFQNSSHSFLARAAFSSGYKSEKGQGTINETISEYPIYLDAVQTVEVHDGHSLSLKLELPHEPPKTIIMASRMFFLGERHERDRGHRGDRA